MSFFDKLLGRQPHGRLGSNTAPTTVDIHNKPLECHVCRHDYFWRHEVQMHTPAASFFDVEWANRLSTCCICARCGFVHQLMNVPTLEDVRGGSR